MLALAGVSWAQAVVTGTVSGPAGPLEQAEVRARNLASGESFGAFTTASGSYSLTVPAGRYDLFANKTQFGTSAQRAVELSAGTPFQFNATLRPAGNYSVPGESSFLILHDRLDAVTGAAPRTADGHPDFTGIWAPAVDTEPQDPPLLPAAAALVAKRRAENTKDDPRGLCLPGGVVRTNSQDLTKFVQTPQLLVILLEGSAPGFRQIFLDGRPHPKDFNPSWMGHSIGRWEGDALVVDTVGLNDKGWLTADGLPQTETTHVVERYRRPNLGTIDVELTIEDPATFSRPFKIHRILPLATAEELLEYVCNENEKVEHYVAH
ncbi:MAG: hypothetical protein RL328_2206 [Acidobacteriota bacterium]